MSNLDARIILTEIAAWARQVQTDPLKAKQETLQKLKPHCEYLEAYLSHFRKMKEKVKSIDAARAANRQYKEHLNECKALLLEQRANLDKLLPHPVQERANIFFQDPTNRNHTSKSIIEYSKNIALSLQASNDYNVDSQTSVHFLPPEVYDTQIKSSYLNFITRADGEAPPKCDLPEFKISNPEAIISKIGNTFTMRTAAQIYIADNGKKYYYRLTLDKSMPTPFLGEMIAPHDFKTIHRDSLLRIIAFKEEYLESDILEVKFVVEQVDAMAGMDVVERPDFVIGGRDFGALDSLGTPLSVLDTPHSMSTPISTPTINREISQPEKKKKYMNS